MHPEDELATPEQGEPTTRSPALRVAKVLAVGVAVAALSLVGAAVARADQTGGTGSWGDSTGIGLTSVGTENGQQGMGADQDCPYKSGTSATEDSLG